jgi:hypothetical protein
MKLIFTILIIFSTISNLFGLKLTKSGNYVIDDIHKLMWQDTKANIRVILTQDHAIEYCTKLELNGFNDWRLATKNEYKYIIDKKRRSKIKINRAFRYKIQDDYWTFDRTWVRNFGKYGYYVKFKNGAIYYQNRTYPMYVRCVRNMR